ncbi:MAG: PKD domain-containing protein [Gammaproteobacteria bacterium]|nr:PKD domain-containing protein [Gammaproteobacteria bacterium]
MKTFQIILMCVVTSLLTAPLSANVVYEESFTGEASYGSGTPQYDNWISFRGQLNTTVSSVTISGSNDPTGVSCTDPTVAQQLATALFDGSDSGFLACNGRNWNVGTCGSAIEFNATGNLCVCSSGYTLRPSINHRDWGGIGSTTCNASSQTLRVEFGYNTAAPVLDNTKDTAGTMADIVLNPVNEDAGVPSGAVGTLVSALVAIGGNVTDPDDGASTGLALTAAESADGTWYYSTDDGANWNSVGAVADDSALLLAADANTRLYFQPDIGTLSAAITFRALDRFFVSPGTKVDTGINGGTTAFSSATDTASITVTPVYPVADFTFTPDNQLPPMYVTFNGSGSSDPDGGTITDYVWLIEGQTYSGMIVGHSFAAAGAYQARLTVTDNDGFTGGSIEKTVTVFDEPPTAVLSVTPSSGLTADLPLTATMDGSASSDPDGPIATYEYLVNGQILSGATATYTFSAASSYSVVLTVTDSAGQTDTDQQTVTISDNSNQPPEPDFSVTPESGMVPLNVALDAGASYDSDGTISAYSWSVNGQTLSGSSVNVTFNSADTHTATLTLTDNEGATATLTKNIVVDPKPVYTLSTASSSGGNVSPGQTYEQGQTATITATPDSACYAFTNWTGTDAAECTAGNPVCLLTMSGDKSLTANFQLQTYTLVVTVAHGTAVQTPSAGSHNCGTSVGLIATPEENYQFARWDGDITGLSGSGASVSLTMDAVNGNRQIVALFEPIVHRLLISKSGTGAGTVTASNIDCGTDCTEEYPQGSEISLVAAAAEGSRFNGWSGPEDCSDGLLTMSGPLTCIAEFIPNPPPVAAFTQPTSGKSPLSVNLDGSGSSDADGSLVSYAWSISGPENQTLAGATTTVTLTAAGVYTITLTVTDNGGSTANAAHTVTVEANTATLTTVASPADGGSIVRDPEKSLYQIDESVTLTAVPVNACREFAEWSNGDCSGNAIACPLIMDTNKSVTANFQVKTFPLSLNVNADQGSVVRNPARANYDCGSLVGLTAAANTGYQFVRWEGVTTSNGTVATLTMTEGQTVTAVFEPITYTLTTNIRLEPQLDTVPDGIRVSIDPLEARYLAETTVFLTAEAGAESGYIFDHWEDHLSGAQLSESLAMSQDMTVTAVFRQPGALAVSPGLTETMGGDNVILNASGGVEPYSWSASAGVLSPDSGPSVNYTAPNAPGEYVVTVQDARPETAQATVKVYPPLALSPQVAEPAIGDSLEFMVSGGKAPYSIVVTNGQVSPLLDEDGDGIYTLTYTAPAAAGRETLTVGDSLSPDQTAAITVVTAIPLRATPETLTLRPNEEAMLTATGGRPAYAWTATGGELLATQGEKVTYLAPNVAGEYIVTLSDSRGETATVTITVILTLGVSPDLATVVLGDPEAVPFHAMGGALPYVWEPVSGQLSGEGADVLYQPPAEEGEHRLILRDSEDTAVTALVRVVSPPILTPGQAILTIGETMQLQVSGGRSPYRWLAEAGDLGQTEGSIVGYTAPSRNGAYTVTVKDALDNQSQAKIRVTGNLLISPLKIVVATGETVRLAAARGVEPYAWSSEGVPASGEGRTWETAFNLAGRHEAVVTDAAGDTALAVVEVIHAALGLTPQSVFLHPGELVNFFVNGGTSPYLWSAEAGSLSGLEGQRTGYIAPDKPGTYTITVADGRDARGRAEVTVTAAVTSAIDGSVQTERGVIRSGIVIDGVPRNEQHILTDQGAHAELSFPLALPEDGRAYNTYGAIVWTGSDGVPQIFFRVNDLFNPLVFFDPAAAFPIYQAASSGENVVVDIYRGLLNGLSGRFDFYAAYAPIGEDVGGSLLFNADPYTLEVK